MMKYRKAEKDKGPRDEEEDDNKGERLQCRKKRQS